MARPDKASAVAELTAEFRDSSAAMLTEYRGLTVAQLKELRRSLGEHASYAVVKNTLTKIAAREAGIATFENLLEGPSAIAFVRGDPVEAARGLRDFSRTHPLLVIKGGVMEGKPLSADEIRKLADLEPREVLLAKLAGAMKASLSGAVALFAAPLAQTARLLEALRQQAESDPSVLRGGPGEASAPDSEPVAADQRAGDDSSTTPETTADSTTDSTTDTATDATTDEPSDPTTDEPAEPEPVDPS